MKPIIRLLTLLLACAAFGPPRTALAQTCTTTTSTLDYSAAPNGDRTATTETVGGATTVTTSAYSTTVAGGRANTFSVGTDPNIYQKSLVWQQNTQNNGTATGAAKVTYTFSRPVSNLTIIVNDIDQSTVGGANFTDRMTFDGYVNATDTNPIDLKNTDVTAASPYNAFVGTGSTLPTGVVGKKNAFTGTSPANSIKASNVTVRFPQPVTKLVLSYENVLAYAAGTDRTQTVGIISMSLCRLAPVANNVTNSATIPTNAGQVNIDNLSSTVDGTVKNYTVTAIPPAAQGVLYYNSTGSTYAAVTNGRTLTPAQAASLRFAPAAGATGTNTTFSYTITDDANLTSAAAATFTIPLQAVTPCVATATLDFSTTGATGEDWKNHAVLSVPAGSSVTQISSGGYTVDAASAANSTLLIGVQTTGNTIKWSNNYANGSPKTSSVTFTFTRPVANFTVRVEDIDAGTNYLDQVVFTGKNGAASVTPSLSPVDPNQIYFTTSGNTATGIAGQPNNGTRDGASVIAYFPSPITTLTLTYNNAAAGATSANQAVGIDLLNFCRIAPVADPVASSVSNAASQAYVNDLSSTVDGTVQSYSFTSVPTAAQGTLFIGNTAVTTGTVITAAQASQLTFTPAAGSTGTFSLNYTVKDDAGQVSSPATYAITVNASGAMGTPAACANPGRDGSPTGLTTNPNTYYPSTATQTVAAGATSIAVGAATGTTNIAAGDLLLIIQMQGADIDATNTDSYGDGVAGGGANGNLNNANFTAGTYEYVVANSAITATAGGTITLATTLKNGYVNAAATTTAGQRRFQVVRVPQFGNLTLGGNITPTAWNGSVGGIIAIDVAKQTNLAGFTINASGAGFRGGGGRKLSGNTTATGTDYRFFSGADNQVTSAHGSKGEGTAGTPKYINILNSAGTDDFNTGSDYPNGSNGRGAPGNAGGGGTDNLGSTNNAENSGGAGGANGGRGGRGGNTWNTNLAIGGEPGAAFAVASSSRLVLGGGGGAGSTNDGSGTPNNGFASSGATGGGLVMLRTGTVSGTGTILANGLNANNTVVNDGSGGGGAGGSILLTATTPAGLANLTLTANGGTGGTNTGGGVPHGPGGGGGGGVILTNGSVATASAAAGATAGTTNGGTSFGANPGLTGNTNNQINNGVANSVSGASCPADVTTTITGPTTLSAGQPAGSYPNYTATFTNNGTGTASNVTQTVTLPAGATVTAANLPAGATFTTTGTGATAVTTVNFGTAASLANGASNTFSFGFTAPATAGSYPLTANVATDANQGANAAADAATLTIQVNNASANCAKSYYDNTNSYGGLSADYYRGDYNNNLNYFNTQTKTSDSGINQVIDFTRNGGTGNGIGTFPITTATLPTPTSLFSARYRGNITITTAGSYTFSSNIDDRLQVWIDGNAIPATGAPQTTTFTPTLGNAIINVPSYTNGTTTSAAIPLSVGQHNILIFYGAGGGQDNVNLKYSGPGITGTVVIPNSVLCAGPSNVPPVAVSNTNAATIPNNAGPTTLNPSLAGTDQDGTVTSYMVNLPSATQGVLYVGAQVLNTTNFPGLVITAAQAAQLKFAPTPGFVGNAAFTFSAIDNTGQYSNDVATYTIPVSAAADVTTALTGPATVVLGQPTGTYTATFTNEGPSAASAVTRKVTLPAGVTNVVLPAGATLSGSTIDFGNATTLASGASNSFNFSFTPATTATGTLAIMSNVTTTTSQGVNTAPDASTLTTTVAPVADVATTLTANTTPVAAGTPATATNPAKFNVTFTNNGPATADGVTGTVQLPAGLTGVIISFPNGANGVSGSYNSTTGVVTYTGATSIPSGGSITSGIAFDAPVNGPVAATSLISTTTNEGGKTANNTKSATIAISPTFDLTTTISGPASAVPGDLVTLAVTTTNNGPSPSPNAVQTVLLPQGLTNVYVSNGGVYNGTSTAQNITVNGVTYTNVQPGQVVFPTVGSLPSGQTVANSVSFSQPGAAYSPAAVVSTTSFEANTANNTAYLNGATSSTPVAVLTPAPASGTANAYTTITSSVASTTIGSPVTLTVVTGNNGPNAATGVTQTVQLLPGLTGVTISNSGTYNSTTGIVTFSTLTTQASGTSVSNTITFNAPASTGNNGQLLAMAAVATTNIDPVPADNVASVGITLAQTADLASTVTGPALAQAGQPVTYTARFVNNGPMVATNVVETVQLPTGLVANAVTITDGIGNPVTNATYNPTTGLVTFATIATDLNGAAQVYNLTFAAPAQNLSVRSNVTSATADAAPANNSTTALTTITGTADLATTVAGPATAVVGSAVTYSVTTTNNGPATATNAVTTLQLATGFTNATLQVGGQTGTLSSNTITYGSGATASTYNTTTGLVTFPTVAAQASGATTTNYVTFVMPNATGGQTTGVASVSSATTDPASGNNTASVATSVAPTTTTSADITAAVTATATSAAPGATIAFTATYGNNGTDPAVNVMPTLQLAPGLTTATITVAGQAGTLSNGLITFPNGAVYNVQSGLVTFSTIASQASGAAGNVSYAVNVTAPANGTVTAVAATTSNTSEPNTAAAQANDVASTSVTVTPSFDEVTSLSGPASAPVGSPVTYTVNTTNNGPSLTTGITTQTVTLPTGVTATNISNSGMQSGNTITWTIPAGQAAGTNGAVANTFTITQPTGGATLTANVTSPGESNTGNNSATATTTVTNLAPLAYAVVNRLQGPQSSDAGGLPNGLLISPLAASDPENSFATSKYTIAAAPDASQGVLYYNNGGTYAAVASGQTLTDAQAQTLKFKAATGYVGNASFTYLTTDAAGNMSPTVNYTIPVETDTEAATYTVLAPKASAYTTGDVLAYTTDVNGAVNNAGTASVYQANGTLQPGANNGVASAVLAATGPTSNPGNTLPAGVSLNPTTGQIYVSDVSATGLMNNPTAHTYSVNVTTIDANGGLTLQTVTFTIKPNPLPVVLTAFTAQAVQNRDALLSWNTASEVNSASFDIERSLDGTAYAKIGEVAAQGTTTTAHAYTYTDASIAARAQGPVYYRLRQVDLNGATSYSPVRTVSFTKVTTIALSLYPNPAQHATTLDVSALPTTGSYQVLVLDATGRSVRSLTIGGGQLQPMNLDDLASGTYQVLVTGSLADGSVLRQVLRLIKE
ncbi:DUF11 domain-containing protein [Hymenobacter psoromatis]|uniref:DUF11 domain-containing protein n=1 Tax=Hymenobacter psoromatis TaxID=1484116 RepID=UPI001CBDE960|nr:DUF11 domain-containing protein [Hymenobacter psoromatis]